MSADNMIYVDKIGDRFCAYMAFASDDAEDRVAPTNAAWSDDLDEILRMAHKMQEDVYTEYGVSLSEKVSDLMSSSESAMDVIGKKVCEALGEPLPKMFTRNITIGLVDRLIAAHAACGGKRG